MSKASTLPGVARVFGRSYDDALRILQDRRRQKRPDNRATASGVLSRIPDAKGQLDIRGTPSIHGMTGWLHKLGHSPTVVDRLNVVHVAGTKGKGSTCAFVESLLRAYGDRTGFPSKTGLYTSPHLIHPEERIRINFKPLDRHLFAKYFFEVWDLLCNEKDLPRYLQLFALLATHVFLREDVEAAIFETHHGGEYDATNFLNEPIATIITPLGMDHAKQLGPTLKNIAWHKAGILKHGAQAFSASQDAAAAAVLEERAREKDVRLRFIADDPELPEGALQLKPDVQRSNASLALACVRFFTQKLSPDKPLHLEDIEKGVAQFFWPGRFQFLEQGRAQWFLDGAHNEMSVVKAAEWFIETSTLVRPQRVLIFAQVSNERNSLDVLRQLALSLTDTHFDHVVLTCYDKGEPRDKGVEGLHGSTHEKLLQEFAGVWRSLHPDATIHLKADIESAISLTESLPIDSEGLQVFVTGSLHLVGDSLRFLTD
ncbi:folylpolyglutamate synthase [Xylariomycetidae sp. FL2044]|nr:folylpolyglutamate synthase [Xylariomycetidae sp. FL2044]